MDIRLQEMGFTKDSYFQFHKRYGIYKVKILLKYKDYEIQDLKTCIEIFKHDDMIESIEFSHSSNYFLSFIIDVVDKKVNSLSITEEKSEIEILSEFVDKKISQGISDKNFKIEIPLKIWEMLKNKQD